MDIMDEVDEMDNTFCPLSPLRPLRPFSPLRPFLSVLLQKSEKFFFAQDAYPQRLRFFQLGSWGFSGY